MQRRHYEDLGKKMGLIVDYHEYDNEHTGLFTTKSDLLIDEAQDLSQSQWGMA